MWIWALCNLFIVVHNNWGYVKVELHRLLKKKRSSILQNSVDTRDETSRWCKTTNIYRIDSNDWIQRKCKWRWTYAWYHFSWLNRGICWMKWTKNLERCFDFEGFITFLKTTCFMKCAYFSCSSVVAWAHVVTFFWCQIELYIYCSFVDFFI